MPASITNRVRAKPSESSLFFVLWSQNRHLWGIGDMPREHSALEGELSLDNPSRIAASQAAIRHVSGIRRIARVPADDIEAVVKNRIRALLAQPETFLTGTRPSPKSEGLLDNGSAKSTTMGQPLRSRTEDSRAKDRSPRNCRTSTVQILMNGQALSDELTSRNSDRMARSHATKNAENEKRARLRLQFYRTTGLTRVWFLARSQPSLASHRLLCLKLSHALGGGTKSSLRATPKPSVHLPVIPLWFRG